MSNIYDKASLVLIPSGTKTSKVYSQKPTNGDGDFTFSRSTAATRVNASGNIEKETQNLFYQSNDFSSAYWNYRAGDSSTGGQSGYDGTNDAWLLSVNSGGWAVYQNYVITGVYTFSLYVKAGTIDVIQIDLFSSSTTYSGQFNLTSGTDAGGGNTIDRTITDVGGGWYRVSLAANVSSTLYARIGSVSVTGNFYIQDAQLEQGLVARDYIETTTPVYGGITDNTPRLDYTDSSCPALLLEPQRFNAIDSSEYGGAWAAINANITKTENATTSPEGVNNAVKLEGLTTSSANQIVNFGTTSLNGVNVVGKTYTASLYLKPVNAGDVGKDIVLSIQRNTGDFEGFNVTTEITSADWKRYDLTYTFTGEGAGDQVGATFKILSPVSTTIDDIYIWGVQFEEGSYATSYIPTYGSAVTRNIDNMQIASGISDLLPQGTGTMYVAGTIVDAVDTEGYLMRIEQASFSNTIFIARSTAGNLFVSYRDGNSTLFSMQKNNVADTFKAAFAFESGNSVLYVNGEQVGTSSVTYTPSVTYDDIRIGGYSANTANMSGLFSQGLVFKTRLSNEELATLTTI